MGARTVKWWTTALALIATGCVGQVDHAAASGAKLLTSKVPDGPGSTHLTALLPDVTLQIEDGCVVARATAGEGGRHSLIFPAGHTLGTRAGRPVILGRHNRVWAGIGEEHSLGGGEIQHFEAAGGRRCPSPYWMVSTVHASGRPGRNVPPPKTDL